MLLKVRAVCMIGLGFACWALAACSFEDRARHCTDDPECAPGRCYQGFCIPARQDTSSSAQTGEGGKSARQDGGSSSSTAGKGNAASGGKGGNSASQSDAGKQEPPPAPAEGACPKEGDEQACLMDSKNTTIAETCNRGMQTCVDGVWTACSGQPMPMPEVCNGRDDDCNGDVDDLIEVCYPQGQAGCTAGADGKWTCTGTCRTGTRTCQDGKLTDCTDAKGPEAEDSCTPEGMTARNEDCDDATDEGCSCRPGATTACYDGPDATRDVGKCKAGAQACVNGTFGPCEGEVRADAETCANAGVDDDCNGTVDDVPTLGNRCVVAGAQGPCSNGMLMCSGSGAEPTCVSTFTPSREVCNGMDDDCNAGADEDFDLLRDTQNCGMCGHRCETGEACCGSRCIDINTDGDHCGGCGTRCPSGQRCAAGRCMTTGMPMAGTPAGGSGPQGGMSGSSGGAGASGSGGQTAECEPACGAGETCCNGNCVNLMTDPLNCNACGNACSFETSGCCGGSCVNFMDETTCGSCTNSCAGLLDGEVLCRCLKDDAGMIGCRGALLNLCVL